MPCQLWLPAGSLILFDPNFPGFLGSYKLVCKLRQVSRRGYYDWHQQPASQREIANNTLVEEIKRVYHESRDDSPLVPVSPLLWMKALGTRNALVFLFAKDYVTYGSQVGHG
jgi:hypothetical protein